MLELAFGSSAGGALRAAKSLGKGMLLGGARFLIGCDGSQRQEPLEQTVYDGPVLEGEASQVLAVDMALDLGNISCVEQYEGRQALYLELLGEEEAAVRHKTSFLAVIERLYRAREAGEAVRIWWSTMPGEACGYCWALWLLRGCPVFSVKLPSRWKHRDGSVTALQGVGSLDPEELARASVSAREIEAWEQEEAQALWDQLAKENAPLRVALNGGIVSAPAYFYDFVLEESLAFSRQQVGEVLSRAIGKGLGVGDWWYYTRLLEMEKQGKVRIEKSKAHPYRAMIRRLR